MARARVGHDDERLRGGGPGDEGQKRLATARVEEPPGGRGLEGLPPKAVARIGYATFDRCPAPGTGIVGGGHITGYATET